MLSDEPDHKLKRITVYPGQRLSLQRHRRHSEHWYIVQGKAVVTLDDREIGLEECESVDIPKGHRASYKESGEGKHGFRGDPDRRLLWRGRH